MAISISTYTQQLIPIYEEKEANAIVIQLIQHITKWSKAKILADAELMLSTKQLDDMEIGLQRLLNHEPIQYVIGDVDFYGVSLKVDPRVLIPRPETEELVEWVLQDDLCKQCIILDCCTGSGCIAVALAKQLPNSTLFACDISQDALSLAKENARRNGVRVNYFQADVLSPSFIEKVKPADIIVSNPPYVLRQEATEMHDNVLKHEPHQALFVPSNDPLIFYRSITQTALHRLSPKGKLYFEINADFGREVVRILTLAGFSRIQLKQDISGKTRMVCAQR
ncbi:MAG: peptide chain release factor N(5)-glutamine methyltransferase [Microbacter sp.]